VPRSVKALMQNFKDDNAGEAARAEPVDRMRQRDEAELREHEIHDAEPREDVLDAERADERREDQRREQRGLKPVASGKAVAGEKDRQRNGDERREGRGE
jgi:hypothetical protein